MRLPLVMLAILLPVATTLAADVAIYPLPAVYEPSKSYALSVNGRAVPVVRFNDDYDYAHFSMGDGPAAIHITVLPDAAITQHDISPWKLKIQAKVQGKQLRFTLASDQYLIVRLNSLRRLVILADPKEADVPAKAGPGVFAVARGADTAAIQSAINQASQYGETAGQGTVYIPAGVYTIGNLQLKSNAAVYLEGGAVLRCTDDRTQLTPHWRKASMNSQITWWISTPPGARNVKLFGRGTLDGNGWNLWEKNKSGQRMANNLLVPLGASGFTCDGIIVRDPSAWAVIPVRSDNVTFTNFKMLCRLNMGENDGIDVCESQNVVVRNSIGIALDDPYSFKTWAADTDISRPWPGDPEPNENILVERAISWTHCFAYKVGQGVFQPQRNITVRDAVVYDAAVGLGVHHKYGTSSVSDVLFENIEVERQHGDNEKKGTWFAALVDPRNKAGGGPVSGITVRDVRVHAIGKTPAMIRGLRDSSTIRGVTFEKVFVNGTPATTLEALNLTDMQFQDDVKVKP